MEKQDQISAGKIVGVHGIRGGMKVFSYLEDPANFGTYKKFFIDGKEVELELNFVKGKVAVIDIEGIRKRELAETYVGKEIFIDKAEMPELKDNEFYYSDLVGLKVTAAGKELGVITDVANYGAGDLFEIKFNDSEVGTKLFPFKKDIFPKIDLEKGLVEINIPEEEFDQN